MPVRAAATASAAVTVVLPTPPLPATMITREVEQKCARSMPQDATGVPLKRFAPSPRARASPPARACGSGALDITDASAGRRPAGAGSARHRRRAGRGLIDPPNADAHPRLDQRRQRTRLDRARAPGRVERRDRRRRRSHRPGDPSGRGCRSSSGSDRPAPTPKGVATLLLEAAHLAFIAPARRRPGASVAARRSRRRAPRATSATGSPRSPRANGRDPDGARRLADEPLSASREAADARRDQRRAPDARRAHRPPRRQDGHDRGRRRRALDREGHRRRARPSPPAEPGGRASTGSTSAARSCTGSSARRSRTSCSSPGSRSSCSSSSPQRSGSPALVGALCLIGAFVGFSHLPVHWWALGLLFFCRCSGTRSTCRPAASACGPCIATVVARRRLAVPLRRVDASCVPRGGCSSWSVVGTVAVHGRRDAGDDPLPLLDAHHRSRGHDRRDGRGRGGRRPRRRRAHPRRALAGPHQPGHARSPPATAVRVVAVDGLVLEVEPPEGGARDYRGLGPAPPPDRIPNRPLSPVRVPTSFRAASRHDGTLRGNPVTVSTVDTWRARAACRGPETSLFFPPTSAERKEDRDAQGAPGQGDLPRLPGAARVPRLRVGRRRDARHLGRPERVRAAGGCWSRTTAERRRGATTCLRP